MNVELLDSGMFSDVMDELGYKHNIITGFMRNNNIVRCFGRARTVLIKTIETKDENIMMGLSFLEQVGSGDVLIVCGSDKFAYFGELMSRLSMRQGINGVIINGLTRDTSFTHSGIPLPILAKGYSPVDIKGRGRVEATDVPINVNGVRINPQDLIFFDNDAICVVPKEIEQQVLDKISEKVEAEKNIKKMIAENISVEQLLKIVKEF